MHTHTRPKKENFDTFANVSRARPMAITWSWLMPAPSTLYTQRDTLNYTAFAIASTAVSSRPKCPAPMVVLENHIGRILDNPDPGHMDICAAAATVCPVDPCRSPLRN